MEEKKCCNCCNNQDDKLMQIISEYKEKDGGIIPALHEIQEVYGYLPQDKLKIVSEEMNISLSEIYGIATFYSRFKLSPSGRHQISVCLGTACYVKGAEKIVEKIKDKFGIELGDTTNDNKFSFIATRCVGACGLAPVVTVDNDVYGKVTPDMIEEILNKYE